MLSWPSAGGGREQDDGQAVISAVEGVPPPAGQYHSTGELLQQQTDTPQVCEGEVSQVQVCEGEVSQVQVCEGEASQVQVCEGVQPHHVTKAYILVL